MGYKENVEIRVGTLTIDTDDVGNVKMFSHSPQREIHEIISGLTNSAIDTKEFITANTMKFTADHHTADKIKKYFGVTPVIVLAGDIDPVIWVAAEPFVVSGSSLVPNRTLLNYGRGSQMPISINTEQLEMLVAGYTNCIPTDIGLLVTGAPSTHTGTLLAYDNTNRLWIVDRTVRANIFAAGDACTSPGTGAGTIIAAGGNIPAGLWPDATQAGAEWVEDTDFYLDRYDASVSRIAGGGMTDPDDVWGWYTYINPVSETMNFPKGDTQVSTRGEYIYTKTLANGKTQEIKIPDGYITNMVEIPHSPGELTEYSIEVKSVEHAASVGFEHGRDRRST